MQTVNTPKTMDLTTRKYNLIQELIHIDKESIMEALENALKQSKDQYQEISKEHKQELDKRIKTYQKDPENIIDWDKIKDTW